MTGLRSHHQWQTLARFEPMCGCEGLGSAFQYFSIYFSTLLGIFDADASNSFFSFEIVSCHCTMMHNAYMLVSPLNKHQLQLSCLRFVIVSCMGSESMPYRIHARIMKDLHRSVIHNKGRCTSSSHFDMRSAFAAASALPTASANPGALNTRCGMTWQV
jgi:hypothetical protein